MLVDSALSHRLDDVEMKLADSEKEADKARKDSKAARDHFNDVKMRRFVDIVTCNQNTHCNYMQMRVVQ